MLTRLACALAFLVLMLAPAHARAATCAGSTVSNVAFGSVTLISGASVNTTGTWTITCKTMNTVVEECLSIGPGTGGSSGAARFMTGPGGATLTFGLYQDAAHTIPWGSRTVPALGTPGANASSTATVNATVPIYGQITAGQPGAAPGAYSTTFAGADSNMYVTQHGQTNCTTGTIDGTIAAIHHTFKASATVQTACLLATQPLSFGTHSFITANVDATTTMTVQCSTGAPYTIGLNNGLTGTGPTARKMTKGASFITYGCYIDAARTNAWSTTNKVSGTGNGASQTITVYGRVPPQAAPPTGAYNDTLTVTVSY